jgi:hypothetical protein
MLQDESGSGDTVSKGVSSADAHPFALADVEAGSVAVPSGDALLAATLVLGVPFALADVEAGSVAVPSGDALLAATLALGVRILFFEGGSVAQLPPARSR